MYKSPNSSVSITGLLLLTAGIMISAARTVASETLGAATPTPTPANVNIVNTPDVKVANNC